MQHPLFHLHNVTKCYGSRHVLEIAELPIFQHEVLAVVGPSGAGKSTLLRLLNFLESPTHGTVQFEGRLYGAERVAPLAVRRRITTVFQRPALLAASVYANVNYGLRLRNHSPRKKDKQNVVYQALLQVGLTDLAEQPARTLSGGEMQRVAVARAVAHRPTLVLADEPTGNLDETNAAATLAALRNAVKREGASGLLVTHSAVAAASADRVLRLARRRLGPE